MGNPRQALLLSAWETYPLFALQTVDHRVSFVHCDRLRVIQLEMQCCALWLHQDVLPEYRNAMIPTWVESLARTYSRDFVRD